MWGQDKISSNSIIPLRFKKYFISNNSGGYENGKLWRGIVMAGQAAVAEVTCEGLNKIV